MLDIKKNKIVSTVGPASEKLDQMRQLVEKGTNVFRLNFSHGDFEEQGARIENVKKLREEGLTIGLLQDTKGPEIRTGFFPEPVILQTGQKTIITMDDVEGDRHKFSVSYKGLANDINPGNRIMLDDGLIELIVDEVVDNKDIHCTVMNSGKIKTKKGVNLPDTELNFEFMSDKDKADIVFGIQNNIDYLAASFVRRKADLDELRSFMKENGGEDVLILPKIECQEALNNIDEIIELSDGIMIARGDLGIEIPVEEVPYWQKYIIKKCNELGKPVITATQLLESMQENPRPTRAEANDVAQAVFDGTDATMLSGESAQGAYPFASVQTMATISHKIEKMQDFKQLFESKKAIVKVDNKNSHAVALAAVEVSNAINASAIIATTNSGYTARQISKFRPEAPIIAITGAESVANKLTLFNGINPVVGQKDITVEEMEAQAREVLINKFGSSKGETVVIVGGYPIGTTNFIKVIQL